MNTFGTSENHALLEQVKVCAEIGRNCMDDNPRKRPAIQDIICRLDEMDISNSSVRSVGTTTTLAGQVWSVTVPLSKNYWVDMLWSRTRWVGGISHTSVFLWRVKHTYHMLPQALWLGPHAKLTQCMAVPDQHHIKRTDCLLSEANATVSFARSSSR